MLTAVGCPGFVEIFSALKGNYSIIGTDAMHENVGKNFVKKFYNVPMGDHPLYYPIINEIASAEKVVAILPEATPELIPLSRSPLAITSPTDSLKTVINKGTMLSKLRDNRPEYRVVKTFKEMEKAINDFGYPDNDVVIKPCVADGSRGLRVLRSQIDHPKMFLDKPSGIVCGWTSVNYIVSMMEARKQMPEYLVMEYLPKTEYSVDCIPELGVAVVRRRDEIRNGIAWKSTVIKNDYISNLALEICEDFRLKYNINIQFKEDICGTPKVIEINPRVSGTIVACIKAGINLPLLAVKTYLGQPVSASELKYKTGTLYRYWGGVWHD